MKRTTTEKTSFASRANRAKSALNALLFLSLALCIALPFNAHGFFGKPKVYTIKILPPANWGTWEPIPCFFTIEAEISADAKENAYVLFKLRDVTQYPGAYMNDILSSDTDRDLKFAEPKYQNTRGGLLAYSWGKNRQMKVAWENAPADLKIPIVIHCRDYAAWGRLEAGLYKRRYVRYKEVATAAPFKIPKDDLPVYMDPSGVMRKGNRIADNWDNKYTIAFTYNHLTMDRDSGATGKGGVPHGKNVGDGLSVHDEYRGIRISGFHTRLNPLEKDVLIYSSLSSDDDGPFHNFVDDGDIGHAGNLPQINVRQIYKHESDSRGRINFRKTGYSIGYQYRIHVFNDENPPNDKWGGNTPSVLSDGREAKCHIFIDNLTALEEWGDVILSDLLDAVIAHEVGHAVGLDHHFSYDGNPSVPPAGEACVMHSNGGHLEIDELVEWLGTDYVDFHTHPAHQHWEDHRKNHWKTYALHSRTFSPTHPSY